MSSLTRHLSLFIAAAILTFCAGLAQAETKTLNFGVISTESTQAQQEIFDPFVAAMAKQTGLEVRPFFATDYAGVIQAMRFDKVDVAWFGNKSAMEAVDRAGGEIFAQTIPDTGVPGYYSLMIVNKDSQWKTLDQVLDHANELKFGNGDPNSTSGYLVPGYYVFAKRGIDPSTAFERTLNSSHETNALAVANGQLDVATFNSESMDRLEQTHPEDADKLRVIWKSDLIPSDPIVYRKNLDTATKQKLRDFFDHYGNTPEQKKILAAIGWTGFKPSTNAQLLPIRQIALFSERQRIEHNEGLDDDTRQARIQSIDKRLDALEQRIKARGKTGKAAAANIETVGASG